MAICSTAMCGVRILSSAWCGVVTATGMCPTACSINVNGRWAAGANQNNGNTSLCFTSHANRLILINRGMCDEQTRYVSCATECATCDVTTITPHEPFCPAPSACDTVDISYIIQDAATVTGLGLITKRVQDYTSTRKFRVGPCGGTCNTTFAYFALLNGASLETVDNSSTTDPDIEVAMCTRFSNGFEANGAGSGGGYMIGTPALAGELVFTALNGAELDIKDNLFFPQVAQPQFEILGACTTGTVRLKNTFGVRQFIITAPGVTYECINLVGNDNACDQLEFNSGVNAETYNICGLELDNIHLEFGLDCATNYSQTFNIVDMNVKRQSTANIIQAARTGTCFTATINLINPKWSPASAGTDFCLDTACSGIYEQFRQNVTVQNPDGTKINGAILNHISTRSGTSAVRITTCSNACGIAILDTEARRWTGVCETLSSSSAHGLQVHNYACQSFATIPTVSNKTGGFGQCLTVAVDADPFVVEGTEATALADGTTKATICEAVTNAHSIIKISGGCGTLCVGETVTGGTSCATGVVKEIIEGCAMCGTVVLITRNGNTFTAAGEALSACGWTGCFTMCSEQRFTWLLCAGQISCTDRTLQQTYDHMKAKLHECPIDTADNWDDMKRWGVGEYPHPIQGVDSNASPKTFQTVRNVTNAEGWIITGLSSYGSVTQFTDDSGNAFNFASQVPVTITVTNCEGNTVSGFRVGVFEQPRCSGDTALACGLTNACGVFSTTITIAGNTNVDLVARLKGYINNVSDQVIDSCNGLVTGITVIKDSIVNLP